MITPLAAGEHTVLKVRDLAESGGLHAVVDACGVPSVPERARELGERRAVSLYAGRPEEELWAIAPYLFAVDGATYDWITSELWGTPWGFFAVAGEPTEVLFEHFRRFVTARTPDGVEHYFRFYDPRVLRRYLATCTAAEREDFFGPVQALATTDPDSYAVVVTTRPEPAAGSRR